MIRKLAAATVLALLAVAAPAAATHVQCGDTITEDTVLDSDIQCGPNQEHGIIIGASDVTLQMAGHKITASAAGADNGGGIRTLYQEPFLSNVEVRRGVIEGFRWGVILAADDSAAMKLTVAQGYHGIYLYGDRIYAYANTLDFPPHPSQFGDENGPAIQLTGDDAYAWGNVLTGSPFHGITAEGERPRIVLNDVEGCSGPQSGLGVNIGGYSTWAVVNRNKVGGNCFDPIAAYANDNSAGGAKIALNQVTGGWDGMYVSDPGAIVGRNTASGASQRGIHIASAGTTVRRNTATDNGQYGIFGPVGTVDGGGNKAAGNGDGTTPQCVNVVCSAP